MSLAQLDAITDDKVAHRPAKTAAPRPLRGIIHHGDCLVVTSPPYNIKNSTGNGLKNGRKGKWPRAALQSGYDGHDDCMPNERYVAWQRDCLAEMMRLLRLDGAIFEREAARSRGTPALSAERTPHMLRMSSVAMPSQARRSAS